MEEWDRALSTSSSVLQKQEQCIQILKEDQEVLRNVGEGRERSSIVAGKPQAVEGSVAEERRIFEKQALVWQFIIVYLFSPIRVCWMACKRSTLPSGKTG